MMKLECESTVHGYSKEEKMQVRNARREGERGNEVRSSHISHTNARVIYNLEARARV